MGPVTRVQTLDEAVYISNNTKTLRKGMHPAMTELFNRGMVTSLGEGILWIQTY